MMGPISKVTTLPSWTTTRPLTTAWSTCCGAQKMTAAIRQASKPCLAFKLLGAGRLCWLPAQVDKAFRFTLANIKKTDGVLVGMYPRFTDEIAHNVRLTLKYGGLSRG